MLFEGVLLRSINCHINSISIQTLSFHNSTQLLLKQRWRKMNGLTTNPCSFGPLTNMADFSYKDGRPAPFGVKQLIRINKQRQYYHKIQSLTGEIDYAVERFKRVQKEKADEKQKILDSKLKQKQVDF